MSDLRPIRRLLANKDAVAERDAAAAELVGSMPVPSPECDDAIANIKRKAWEARGPVDIEDSIWCAQEGFEYRNVPKQFTAGLYLGLLKVLADIQVSCVVNAIVTGKTVGSLRKRVEELEARPVFKDCGVWRDGFAAVPGNGVTHEGSFWLAQCATVARPGTNGDWRLAVKRGRDGKDAR